MGRKRRLLLYRNGPTAPQVVADVGDYFEWFTRVIGDRAEVIAHWAQSEPRPPLQSSGFDGVVLTGSPLSLVEPAPWMDEASEFTRQTAAAGIPVLGVCFGHQLLGYAWGGRVRVNPRGWEAGTHEVELTPAGRTDPLFQGIPDRLQVNQSHRDEVSDLGPETIRLAGSEHSENQAIGIGEHVRGVQFHPEMNGTVIRRVISHRHSILTEDAHKTGRSRTHHADVLLDRSKDTPEAELVVLNFLRGFVERA